MANPDEILREALTGSIAVVKKSEGDREKEWTSDIN
jgi:hypothetical protein